jgi:hypothetical protein
MYKTITVNTIELILDEKNPRFVTKNDKILSQEKILEYLINYENVIELANEINEYGGLVPGERLLVIKEDNKYKVLEGNRRTAAMHLLLNPTLIPSNIPDSRKKQLEKLRKNIRKECLENISKIEVDLVQSRDDAIYALTKRHIDGIKKWSQISKMFFYRNHFEQGKKLNELKEYTGESTSRISTYLKQYSFLRFILDNYSKFYPNSTISNLEIETQLNTDFIVSRIFNFICEELDITFTRKTYEIDLSKLGKTKTELLAEILVKISYLYWGEDGKTAKIDSRKLNKKEQIKDYFINSPSDKNAKEIAELIKAFKNLKNEQDEDDHFDDHDQQDEYDHFGDHDQQDEDDHFDDHDQQDEDDHFDDHNQQDEDDHFDDHNQQDEDDHFDDHNQQDQAEQNQRRYMPRDPASYNKLTKAFKLNHHYKENPRINKTKKELSEIEYKKFPIASMYLIRSLLETYVNEYIDHFSSLSKTDNYKMRNISSNRKEREKKNMKLQDLIYNHIKNHLKSNFEEYSETYELIETAFSNNNNTSTMKIINYHIHSSTDYPDETEILNAWKKISVIINTLDKILAEHAGQK